MNLTLTIAHNVFLTKEQRYGLFDGNTVEVIGVSVPVWYYNGTTSEPATEVFCAYKLIPDEKKFYVNYTKNSYELLLSKNSYATEGTTETLSLRNLLDLKDGGINWLAFRQFNKIKKNKKDINMVHFVEIKPIQDISI
jgi:hypothetical protein